MTQPVHIGKGRLLNTLPAEWPQDLLPDIQRQLQATGRKLVVLDDDPTGTQTVHDIPVLTGWTVELLRAELAGDAPAFYLLTNSRSLPLAGAQGLNAEIGRNLAQAARQSGRDFDVVSRSDSTLRGHFPGEVQALADALAGPLDAWLVIPFFLEGGRYTVDDIHYVAEGDNLVPAGETEFAQDATFGYRASNLREWVAEKTGGQIPAGRVASISIVDLRRGGPEQARKRLLDLQGGQVCIVNAASYRDLEVLAMGLLAAEAQGKRFLYRTAASFVRVRAGLAARPLLVRKDLALGHGGGLVVVGSYVPKTSGQVSALIESIPMRTVEVSVDDLLAADRRPAAIERAAQLANAALQRGQDVLVMTSRRLVTGRDAESSLEIGRQVSESLVAIVRNVTARPRYVLAKGGITSSDVATRGLDVRRAMVRGQILPGVPVWELGAESRYPGLPYIVFPGNVGGPQALADIVRALK